MYGYEFNLVEMRPGNHSSFFFVRVNLQGYDGCTFGISIWYQNATSSMMQVVWWYCNVVQYQEANIFPHAKTMQIVWILFVMSLSS